MPSCNDASSGNAQGSRSISSVLWLWAVEGIMPDRWDIVGTMIGLTGAGVILFGTRSG